MDSFLCKSCNKKYTGREIPKSNDDKVECCISLCGHTNYCFLCEYDNVKEEDRVYVQINYKLIVNK